MDPAIKKFLSEQKEKKLKEKKKTEEQIEKECSMEYWLIEASKKAGHISLSTHPCKFSHPSIGGGNKDKRTTSVVFKGQPAKDGYLKSGQVEVKQDAYMNAAYIPIYKFLDLEMKDGKTLLEHIDKNETTLPGVLECGQHSDENISMASYKKLREGILKIKEQEGISTTDSRIKQVYFPVGDKYHQLSILTPSGLISSMKERIQEIHFGEENKEARNCRDENRYTEKKYRKIYNLTVIGYGGTKAQNISVLNNKNGGKFYLLPSLPPQLEVRKTRLPKRDFFQESLWIKFYKDNFYYLHKILIEIDKRNNIDKRQIRDETILDIFYQMIIQVERVREQGDDGWTDRENYKNLPAYQKHILDNVHKQTRKENSESGEYFLKETARWIMSAYKKLMKQDALEMHDSGINHFYKVISEEGMEVLL